jgi:4-oxalocrotonate tautomerase
LASIIADFSKTIIQQPRVLWKEPALADKPEKAQIFVESGRPLGGQWPCTDAYISPKGGYIMPIIDVKLFAGRSIEQKRKLVAGITDAVVQSLDVKPDTVRITLIEMARDNHAVAGILDIDKK